MSVAEIQNKLFALSKLDSSTVGFADECKSLDISLRSFSSQYPADERAFAALKSLSKSYGKLKDEASQTEYKNLLYASMGGAPADEYFGKQKLSVLGIRNIVKDTLAELQNDPSKASDAWNKAQYVENSFWGWQSQYPRDTHELARMEMALARLYAAIGTSASIAEGIKLSQTFDSLYSCIPDAMSIEEGKLQ